MRKLRQRWLRRFNQLAKDLASYFATEVAKRTDAQLLAALRRGGFTVKFVNTRATNDVIRSVIAENVSLIKSIPEQHLGAVEGIVLRSVQRGGDLASLVKDLQERHQVTRRRAELIARDQTNKATAMLQRTRQLELGIREAIWVHSGGGRHPRASHVRAGRDRVRFDLKTGWYDPEEQRYVLPGELINCRCVARPVVPGLS
jgi:SPP1 gp7 family putative phage head morphogenesis protein